MQDSVPNQRVVGGKATNAGGKGRAKGDASESKATGVGEKASTKKELSAEDLAYLERERSWQAYINDRRGGPLRTRGLCINERSCIQTLVREFTDEQIKAIDQYLATEHWKYKRNPCEIGGKALLDESRPTWQLVKDRVQPKQATTTLRVVKLPTVGSTSVQVIGRKETPLERHNRELREMFAPVAGRA